MEGYIKLVFFFYAEDLLTFVYMYKCVCKQKNKTNKKQKNQHKKDMKTAESQDEAVKMHLIYRCVQHL